MSTVIAVLALLNSYHMVDVGWSTGILVSLGAGALAGFAEEILFQGILLRLTEGWVRTWWALAITSFLSGISHLGSAHATVFGVVVIALEAGILLGACYLLTRHLWLTIGPHAAWNFVQDGTFGSNISSIGSGRGLVEACFTGPDLLTSEIVGIEVSVIAIIVCTAASVAMLLAVCRCGFIVPPYWRHPLQAALNDTQPAQDQSRNQDGALCVHTVGRAVVPSTPQTRGSRYDRDVEHFRR